MKITRLAMLFCFITGMQHVAAQAKNEKGIQFFEGSWKELLDAAKKEHKAIFLDMYTDWCGPCKLMDKNIFPAEKVGNKYNPLFLNYRVNAEKGEGIEIARRFNVSIYPTFLFLNNGGSLVYKVIGEKEMEPFIGLADQAMKDVADKDNPGNMEAQFNNGVMEPAFLRAYITRLTKLDMDNSKVLDAYFTSLPFAVANEEETLVFLGQNIMNSQSATLAFFMDNYDKLSKASRDKVLNHLYDKLIGRAASQALGNKNMLEFKRLIDFAGKLEIPDKKKQFYINRLRLAYCDLVRDNKEMIATGYKMAAGLTDIPIDSIRSEDARQFSKVMQPFLTGEKDSTAFPGFSEEKKFLQKMYTKDISSKLYIIVQAFAKLPDSEVQALKDALVWIKKACLLEPDIKPYATLAGQLEKRLH